MRMLTQIKIKVFYVMQKIQGRIVNVRRNFIFLTKKPTIR